MAIPKYRQTAILLPLLLHLATAQTRTSSLWWTHTSRMQYSASTSIWTYGSSEDYITYTATRTISPSITPTGTPESTSTYDYDYEDLLVVYEYYTPGAVPDADLLPETTAFDDAGVATAGMGVYTNTYFQVEVTYTAPASCPTPFSWSTYESVNVPTEVVDQITPVSKITEAPAVYSTWTAPQYETWIVSEGAAPLFTPKESQYYYTAYVEDCDKPYEYDDDFWTGSGGGSGSGSGSGGGDDSSGLQVCYSYYGACTSLQTWIIIVATILPSLFLLGFLESWFWFRRLMIGKGCLRFGTVLWIMLSLWVACFTRKQSKRSTEDQKLLYDRWKAMGSGQAFKLWFKWGFRHKYPVDLLGQYSPNTVGIVPAGQPLRVIGQAFHGQQGPVYYPPPQVYYPPPVNGQGYAQPQTTEYYGEQAKEGHLATATPSPVPVPMVPTPTHQPTQAGDERQIPSPIVPSPPPHVSEVPTPPPPPKQQ